MHTITSYKSVVPFRSWKSLELKNINGIHQHGYERGLIIETKATKALGVEECLRDSRQVGTVI